MSTFAITNSTELLPAVNYLLSNLDTTGGSGNVVLPGNVLVANTSTGVVSQVGNATPFAYLYQYVNLRYSNNATGTAGFDTNSNNYSYFGVYNSTGPTPSANPSAYQWYEVSPPFNSGTSRTLYYSAIGGRQIQWVAASAPPSTSYQVTVANVAIDLDVVTTAAGTPGDRGPIALAFVITTADPNSASSAQLTSWFEASRDNVTPPIGTGLTPVVGDTATFTYAAGVGQPSGTFTYNGSIWTAVDGQIVSGSVLIPDSVSGNSLANSSVINSKIANSTITGAKIAPATLTGNLIVDSTITGNLIANNTITGSLVAANTIAGFNIIGNTITGDLIAGNTITGNKIAASTITGNLIAGNTITGNLIAANTIAGFNIVGNTITGNLIAANTITGNNIAGNTITGSLIQANTITGNLIAANTIAAVNIVTGSITTNQIAANTITGNNIAVNTIAGTNIQGNTITGNLIAANTITSNNIQTGTITANNIQTGTLTTNLFTANTISGNIISGGSITTDKLAANVLTANTVISTGATIGNTSSTGFWLQGNTGNARFGNAVSIGNLLTVGNNALIGNNLSVGNNATIGGNLNVTGLITTGSLNSNTVATLTIQPSAVTSISGAQSGSARIATNASPSAIYLLTGTAEVAVPTANASISVTWSSSVNVTWSTGGTIYLAYAVYRSVGGAPFTSIGISDVTGPYSPFVITGASGGFSLVDTNTTTFGSGVTYRYQVYIQAQAGSASYTFLNIDRVNASIIAQAFKR